MSHKEQMIRAIEAAMDAMPTPMRPCDMAHLFAHFIIQYNLARYTDDIVLGAAKMVKRHVDPHNLWNHEDVQSVSAIKDADMFLAKIQARNQG